tara:strand:- start:363 stop:1208 length:846 start_codon:yes stop_codon:yes gene_type:complete
VEIIWPKLDVPYWYNKDAPNPFNPDKIGFDERVEKTDKRGAYQCAFLVTQEQAQDLAKTMGDAFANHPKTKGKTWTRNLKNPETGYKAETPVTALHHIFEKREEYGDRWIVKTNNNCFGDPTTKPPQYDATGKEYPDDFQLTKHSKGHANIKIDPWAAASAGVSLRLEELLISELAERKEFEPTKPKEHPFKDLVGEAPKTGFEDILTPTPAPTAQPSLMPDAPVQTAPEKSNPFGNQASAPNPFGNQTSAQNPSTGVGAPTNADVDTHPSLQGVEDEIPF